MKVVTPDGGAIYFDGLSIYHTDIECMGLRSELVSTSLPLIIRRSRGEA